MADTKKTFDKEMQDLQRVRDELRVQMHLAKQDAKDRFHELEQRWEKLEAKARVLGHEAEASLDEIGDAARILLEEIRNGYRRLRELL